MSGLAPWKALYTWSAGDVCVSQWTASFWALDALRILRYNAGLVAGSNEQVLPCSKAWSRSVPHKAHSDEESAEHALHKVVVGELEAAKINGSSALGH